jgi:NADH-quinone oxidoreductase subunit A
VPPHPALPIRWGARRAEGDRVGIDKISSGSFLNRPNEGGEPNLLSDYGPLLIFFIISSLVVVSLVAASFVIGPSRPNRRKLQAYESGIVPTARARHRMSVKFYLTAMIFIIFDIEAVFFYPWAVILRQLRWYGLIEMFVFMVILLVALAHIWRKGGLEWD